MANQRHFQVSPSADIFRFAGDHQLRVLAVDEEWAPQRHPVECHGPPWSSWKHRGRHRHRSWARGELGQVWTLEDFFETWKICENCIRLLQMGGTMWYIFLTSLNQCLERWDDWLWLVWSTKKVQHGGLCTLPETRTLNSKRPCAQNNVKVDLLQPQLSRPVCTFSNSLYCFTDLSYVIYTVVPTMSLLWY